MSQDQIPVPTGFVPRRAEEQVTANFGSFSGQAIKGFGQTQTQTQTADQMQAGGDHYKSLAVQPWHLMEHLLTREEFIGFLKGNMIKYAMRQGRKDSPDAAKYTHYRMKLQEILNA